jgi:hypothetical protein
MSWREGIWIVGSALHSGRFWRSRSRRDGPVRLHGSDPARQFHGQLRAAAGHTWRPAPPIWCTQHGVTRCHGCSTLPLLGLGFTEGGSSGFLTELCNAPLLVRLELADGVQRLLEVFLLGSSSVRGRGTPSHSWHRLDRAHPLDLSQVGQRGDAALPMWTKSSKVDRVDSYLYMCSEADSEILLDFASQWEGLSASARTCRRPE